MYAKKKSDVREPKTEKVERRMAPKQHVSRTVRRPVNKVKLVEKDNERDKSPAPQRERADSSDHQQSATRRGQAHHVPRPRRRTPTRAATPPIIQRQRSKERKKREETEKAEEEAAAKALE